MEDGYEQWLVIGSVFKDRGGYAKLVARIILEFKGWEGQEWDNKIKLVGRGGDDGKEVTVYERWGPKGIWEHTKTEHQRLRCSIFSLLNTWYAYHLHLRTSGRLTCTCRPSDNCVVAARDIADFLKTHKLVGYKRNVAEYTGSLLSLRQLLQSLEVRLDRGIFGELGYGSCRVYEGIAKMMNEMDGVLEGVKGVDWEGRVEKVGIREVCGREMAVPWMGWRLGLVVRGWIAWAGLKAFLRGVGRLERFLE
ncbi:uncharacterized protein DFL_000427 [Arthrobotrys flagrans]|uniref:Uncharacterized protein n=1 Tax=Arthrobotrys flagrans TaxID=97331 RepID=A0A437AF34_ARTFL|nr:hypothetical protein DFL_000427 [Arthrobotrys flagrans]